MKFGIFYEHPLPHPWTDRSEYELLQNSLVEVELADQLGYDYATSAPSQPPSEAG